MNVTFFNVCHALMNSIVSSTNLTHLRLLTCGREKLVTGSPTSFQGLSSYFTVPWSERGEPRSNECHLLQRLPRSNELYCFFDQSGAPKAPNMWQRETGYRLPNVVPKVSHLTLPSPGASEESREVMNVTYFNVCHALMHSIVSSTDLAHLRLLTCGREKQVTGSPTSFPGSLILLYRPLERARRGAVG